MELINDFKLIYLAVVSLVIEKVDKSILQRYEKTVIKNLLVFLTNAAKLLMCSESFCITKDFLIFAMVLAEILILS